MTRPPASRRLSSEDARDLALDAARALLVENGPQAVTLKAVGARIGRTHANLLHHFGSAEDLRRALAWRMAESITASIGEAVRAARAGTRDPRAIVDLTFDAFDREGGGALASWMILSGDEGALDPILAAIQGLVERLGQEGSIGDRPIAEETLQLVLMALGDALLGGAMARALGLARETARELALEGLVGKATAPRAKPASSDAG